MKLPGLVVSSDGSGTVYCATDASLIRCGHMSSMASIHVRTEMVAVYDAVVSSSTPSLRTLCDVITWQSGLLQYNRTAWRSRDHAYVKECPRARLRKRPRSKACHATRPRRYIHIQNMRIYLVASRLATTASHFGRTRSFCPYNLRQEAYPSLLSP